MKEQQLRALFPNATEDFIRRNTKAVSRQADIPACDPGKVAVVERDCRHGAMAEVPFQKGLGQKFLVCVKAIRCRLLDEDNMCEKYHVDLCRYAGAIPNDGPATTRIQVSQQKAEPGAGEEIIIEIYQL